jgi:hypothetical protein
MNRLTATVAKAHLNAIAWLFEQGAEQGPIKGTMGTRTTNQIAQDFRAIADRIAAEDWAMVTPILLDAVRGWQGHGYNLDQLGAALSAYGAAMAADEISTRVRIDLSNEAVAVLGRAREIARHSS